MGAGAVFAADVRDGGGVFVRVDPGVCGAVAEDPRAAWRWLVPGAALVAFQAVGMAYGLGVDGRATAANILYGTRGLWSVLAVSLLGAWLGTEGERNLPARVRRWRLVGAGLMFAAVALG